MKEKSLLLDFQDRIRTSFWLFPVALFLRVCSWFFLFGTWIRKWFLRTFCSFVSPIPVLSVGSVTVGGAGKTPVILLLMKRLQSYRLGYVSRGYGKEQKGDVVASHLASSRTVGDEAFLLSCSVPSLVVAVGDSKRRSIERLSSLPLDFIFLDDALQRYNINSKRTIGVLPDRLLFEKEYVLPLGLLREPISRLQEADLLFIVRESEERPVHELKEAADRLAPSVIVEHEIVGWTKVDGSKSAPPGRELALLCGIARPHRVIDLLERNGYRIVEALSHGDHGSLLSEESLLWAKKWNEKGIDVVATAKDWARHVPWPEEWHFCRFLQTELVPLAGEDVLNTFIVGIV